MAASAVATTAVASATRVTSAATRVTSAATRVTSAAAVTTAAACTTTAAAATATTSEASVTASAVTASVAAATTGKASTTTGIATATAGIAATAAMIAAAAGEGTITPLVSAIAVVATEAMAAPAMVVSPAKPRPDTEEDAVVEIVRPPETVGSTGIGRVVVISVGTYGRRPNVNRRPTNLDPDPDLCGSG